MLIFGSKNKLEKSRMSTGQFSMLLCKKLMGLGGPKTMMDINSILRGIVGTTDTELALVSAIGKHFPEAKGLRTWQCYDKEGDSPIYTREIHAEFYIFGYKIILKTTRSQKWVIESGDGIGDPKRLVSFWWDAATGRFSRCKRTETPITEVEDYAIRQMEKAIFSLSATDGRRFALPETFKYGRYTVFPCNAEIICKDEKTGNISRLYNDKCGLIGRSNDFPMEIFALIEKNFMKDIRR